MAIQIKNKAIPALPRSKNYPVGTTILNSGGGSQSSSSSGPVSDTGLTKEIRVNAPQTGHISPGAIFKQGTGYEQQYVVLQGIIRRGKPTPLRLFLPRVMIWTK